MNMKKLVKLKFKNIAKIKRNKDTTIQIKALNQ